MQRITWPLAVLAVLGIFTLPAFAQTPTQRDTPLVLWGFITDTDVSPIEGAVIEIWQTDLDGNYDHPQDSHPDELDDRFQYFGSAITASDGSYVFQTIKPGDYEPRPAHIHFKVKIEGATVLTSQFYFVEDGTRADATLLVEIEDVEDPNGNPLRVGQRNIVIDRNGSAANTLTATASQTEGPFYPVVDFVDYDNNLLNAETNEIPLVFDTTSATLEPAFALVNLNTSTIDDIMTIPDLTDGVATAIALNRPYSSIEQFRQALGSDVDEDIIASYEAFVYVPIDYNTSDAATLMQIPGIDQDVATAIVNVRPFDDEEAFWTTVMTLVPDLDRGYAAYFLDSTSSHQR